MPTSRGERAATAAWVALVLLVVAFLLHQGSAVTWMLSAVIVLAGISIRRPITAISLLPATALLGPIATISLPGSLLIHLGDIYLAALALSFVVREGWFFPVRLGRDAWLLGLLMVFVAVSWLFSLDMIAALPTVVGIAEFILLYLVTQYAVHDSADVDAVVKAWLAAATLSSVLVIVSYLQGDVLILGASSEARAHAASMRTSESLLFRASFFVTSFIFPLASTIAICAAKLMFEARPTPPRRVLVLALIVNLAALVAMANATAAAGAALGIGLLVVFLPFMRSARRRYLVGAAGTLAAVFALIAIVVAVLPPAQTALLLGRTSDTGSLEARMYVWRNVFAYLLDSPHTLYLGLGPDVSIRLANSTLMRSLFLGGGLQQGAVDSGYLYLVLDYGLLAFAAVMLIGLRSLSASFAAAKRGYEAGVLLWVALAVWAIMSLTQQHGVAKPVFMIIQIAALSDILRRLSHPQGTLNAPEPDLSVDPRGAAFNFS
ncbi:MAG: hypothetical protein ACJ8AK_10545 [Gemmatimonadaceae bacterium]